MTTKIDNQPQAVDFTEIEEVDAERQGFGEILKEFTVSVILDGKHKVQIGAYPTFGKAEDAELAMSQAMIEYREKRNKWENGE